MSSLFNRSTSVQANPHAQDWPALTAADALAQITSLPDLSATERRDLISAINTIVRVAGAPADLLPLTPERLRATVISKSAAGWGVSPEARSNVLWRLRKISCAGWISSIVRRRPWERLGQRCVS